jgi:hypothetical protein
MGVALLAVTIPGVDPGPAREAPQAWQNRSVAAQVDWQFGQVSFMECSLPRVGRLLDAGPAVMSLCSSGAAP